MNNSYRLLMILLLPLFMGNDIVQAKNAVLYDNNNLCFIENKGQVRNQQGISRTDIDFVLKGKEFSVFVGCNGLHYQWNKSHVNNETKDVDYIESYRIDAVLTGANKYIIPQKLDVARYTERCYGPSFSKDGMIANAYKKIVYPNVYPQIDWVIYIDEKSNNVKYDFVVHNGGDARNIKVVYNGAEQLRIEKGALHIQSPMGTITEHTPYSYYAASNEKIKSSYSLDGNQLSFSLEDYTPTKKMIIDPSLEWSTYFGGSDIECAYAVSSDTAGNSYLVGHTTSNSSIATTGAYQSTYAANKDAYIACFDSAGILQWATYYGGNSSDNFFYVATDTLGGIYAAGITATTSGMTTTGAHQTTYGGGVSDAYLVKFSSTGARVWATYFGGAGDEATVASFDDYMVSVTWDKSGNKVYLCGMTTSSSGIATSGVYQTAPGGGKDGYLAQFTTSGALQWATYFGDTGDDKIVKMSADATGNLYVTGVTNSTSNIATSGSHLPVPAGGVDAFIAKFSQSGSRLWATYYGGSNDDGSSGIANDNAGSVYIAGSTTSTSGISTTGSFQPAIAGTGPSDAFLVKFDANGSRQWGTYLGGMAPDNTADIAIDANNNICFSGTTGSTGISTPGSYQPSFGGNSDGYLAVFGPQGTRTWVSYFGGSGADNSFGISYSRTGDLYVAGNTGSSSGISTIGSYQMVLNGAQDGYVAKFKADTSAYITSVSPMSICQGDSVTVHYAITNPFLSTNTFSIHLSDAFGSFGTYTVLGSIAANTAGSIRVRIPLTTTAGTQYRMRVAYTAPAGVGYDNGQNITVKLKPVAPAISTNSPICSGNMLAFTASSTTPNVTYNWIGPNGFLSTSQTEMITPAPTNVSGKYVATATLNGCITKDSFTAVVDSTPVKPIIIANGPTICSGNTILLNASSTTNGVTYEWKGPASFSSTLQNPSISSATAAQTGYYVVTAKFANCSSKDSTQMNVFTTLTPDINAIATPVGNICQGDLVSFTTTVSGGGSTPTYQWYINNNPVNGATTGVWGSNTLTTGDVVYCIYTANGWPCLTKPADTSTKFTINALGNVPPTVSIQASPGLTVPTGTAITFTATHTNMGATPSYRWLKNGVTVQNGKTPVYIAVVDRDVVVGDQIALIMTSSLVCADPDTALSNVLTMGKNIILSVAGVGADNDWQLYPNPNIGKFVVSGYTKEKTVLIDIVDAVGRIVYSEQLAPVNGNINHNVLATNMSSGAYILRIHQGDKNSYLRFSVVN